MVMLTLPIIFLPPLTFIPILFILTFFFKIGCGFMIISQLFGLSKITQNKNHKVMIVL